MEKDQYDAILAAIAREGEDTRICIVRETQQAAFMAANQSGRHAALSAAALGAEHAAVGAEHAAVGAEGAAIAAESVAKSQGIVSATLQRVPPRQGLYTAIGLILATAIIKLFESCQPHF